MLLDVSDGWGYRSGVLYSGFTSSSRASRNTTGTWTNYYPRYVYSSIYVGDSKLLTSIQSLDTILSDHVAKSIEERMGNTPTLTQVAQIITNLEHFEIACVELERSLTALRSVLSYLTHPHPEY